jgi:hypothetical protein
MKKFSTLAIMVTVTVGISAPAMAQIAGPPAAPTYVPPIYNYAPAPPLFMGPAGPAYEEPYYGGERWGGYGPSGDYGPGRP